MIPPRPGPRPDPITDAWMMASIARTAGVVRAVVYATLVVVAAAVWWFA